ncbi:insulinase family protein [Thiomicrorhabdus sp.]|uniref:insulinase family protein n=1 Tax=Thiomicrorhabdus sp. TaxID=2039724 RepID=UPI0029C712C3|nr:insulinase family protein [Thiomicrorhabdus sp.]
MKHHPAFEFLGQTDIETLQVQVSHYRHKITGAEHYHLAADDPQNVFLVALRTVPMDSTGVAHILEHTALCGSRKYPVRDPFFMMIRRSLNTFMNAFTSSDWTAYPFATENRKDFQNLLQVYMDAVFFPNLHALDFAQEGHRFEFEDKTDASSPLVYKGVVFNEMKGAMSSPISTLWQTLSEKLYPTSTYHYNSGGDPEVIPELTHQQLMDFHRFHYHPSNSVFMTYGDISAYEHQCQFEALALSEFTDRVEQVKVGLEQRFEVPQKVQSHYALDEEETENKTHIVMGWLLGLNQDPLEVLKGHLLSAVLLDNSASPMRKVLEETELGAAPSPLCGLEESNKEMAFVIGVQGAEAENTDAVEDLILQALQRIVDEGIDQSQLEAMLHQLELSQREVGGDSYPYGLQLILHSLSGAMHDGDPIALLDVDNALQQLEEEIQNPQFIPHLVKTWLLDNPHRVTLTLKPDTDLSKRSEEAEKNRLAEIQSHLSSEEAQAIIDQALALEARQAEVDDVDILPEVTKEDIPAEIKSYRALDYRGKAMPVHAYECGSNGIAYQQLLVDLPKLTIEEQQAMSLFNSCLPELGSGGRDYLQTQHLQSAVTGSLSARTSLHSKIGEPGSCHSHFILSSKALNRNSGEMSELLQETLYEARFDELPRIKDLMGQIRSSIDHGITGSGHSQAVMAAVQNYTLMSAWKFNHSGFAGIRDFKTFYKTLEDTSNLEAFANRLSGICDKLGKADRQAVLIGDEVGLKDALGQFEQTWTGVEKVSSDVGRFELEVSGEAVKEAWITSTQVNFCAMAYPAVQAEHPDAPKLAVLGACLRNGFLHTAVREKGGAYGGGASYNSEAAGFVFFSYRDPRLLETFDDFARAKEWLMSSEATQAKVDEAILNVISAMDKPGSPAGEMRKAFYQELYGRSQEIRMAYREGVISTTVEELRAVAERYFDPQKASFAVLTHSGMKDALNDQGFALNQL